MTGLSILPDHFQNDPVMLYYLLALRLIHIVAGICWAGAAIAFTFFVMPAIHSSGPEGGKVMGQIAAKRYPQFMLVTSTLNVGSGVLLYWQLSNGFQLLWLSSTHGIVLMFGGVMAISAYFTGAFVVRPNSERMAKIGQAIALAGGKPNENQALEMARIRRKTAASTKLIAVLLSITVIAMAAAKYV